MLQVRDEKSANFLTISLLFMIQTENALVLW